MHMFVLLCCGLLLLSDSFSCQKHLLLSSQIRVLFSKAPVRIDVYNLVYQAKVPSQRWVALLPPPEMTVFIQYLLAISPQGLANLEGAVVIVVVLWSCYIDSLLE